MQKPPAWVIAAWPEPNYVDPETHGWGNVILNIVLFVVLCCFISLRIWTRTRLRASFGADDMMILFAMVGFAYYPNQSLRVQRRWMQYYTIGNANAMMM